MTPPGAAPGTSLAPQLCSLRALRGAHRERAVANTRECVTPRVPLVPAPPRPTGGAPAPAAGPILRPALGAAWGDGCYFGFRGCRVCFWGGLRWNPTREGVGVFIAHPSRSAEGQWREGGGRMSTLHPVPPGSHQQGKGPSPPAQRSTGAEWQVGKPSVEGTPCPGPLRSVPGEPSAPISRREIHWDESMPEHPLD